MRQRHPLLTGACILTLTGIATRFLGFFYKIFLSRTIGAEGMGIYQMIFPIFGICLSLTASGIETAISRFVAEESAAKNPKGARNIFFTGLFLSISLSVCAAFILYQFSDFLAVQYLKELRCGQLLRILSYAIPFAACHASICGYYFGLKKTSVPAISQLLEQVIRVGSVYVIASIFQEKGLQMSPVIAVIGLFMGECVTTFFCLSAFSRHAAKQALINTPGKPDKCLKKILSQALPLTGNRVSSSLLASLEAVLLPLTLKASGLTTEGAYEIYGTLTGMSLSFIFFPQVLTGSLSVLLLPAISETMAGKSPKNISKLIRKTTAFCLPYGILCGLFFLITGNFLGSFFFESTLAGDFIKTLSFLCPFLYLNGTFTSILNGMGRTGITFRNTILGITIRILFTLFFVPVYGIEGYLWGLLANQILVTGLCVFAIKKAESML